MEISYSKITDKIIDFKLCKNCGSINYFENIVCQNKNCNSHDFNGRNEVVKEWLNKNQNHNKNLIIKV